MVAPRPVPRWIERGPGALSTVYVSKNVVLTASSLTQNEGSGAIADTHA